MDAAEYDYIARQLGVPLEEALHELACARYDLRRLPETVHGRDEFQIAADALTASRALPRPELAPVEFVREAWTPGDALAARRRQTAQ